MEKITTHMVNELNEALEIKVLDKPGPGNACHNYQIEAIEKADINAPTKAARLTNASCRIRFQNGPINEQGVNGISNEALLAVVEHRLCGFQSGDYSCHENALALIKLQEAMVWLHKRTTDRIARKVEGTNKI